MNLLQSLTYAKTCVDTNDVDALQQWTVTQSSFAVQSTVEYALHTQAWPSAAVLMKSPKYNESSAAHILRQQVFANNITAVQHLSLSANPFHASTAQGSRMEESAMRFCIKTNNTTMLKVLLDGVRERFVENHYRYTSDEYSYLLHAAAQYNNVEICQTLTQYHPPVWEEINDYGLLEECMSSGSFDVAWWLINTRNIDFKEVAQCAIEYDNTVCLQLLKNHLTFDEYCETILLYCEKHSDLELLKVFGLDEKTITWSKKNVPIIIQSGNLELFKKVVPHQFQYTLSASDYQYLCQNSDEDKALPFLRWMIEQVNPLCDNSYALKQSLSNRKWKFVEELLPLSNPNQISSHLIMRAGECPNVNVIQQLCEKVGHHITQDLFEIAASCGNVNVLGHLLPHVNPKYNCSQTLRVAISNGCQKSVKMLLPYSDLISNNFSLLECLCSSDECASPECILQAVSQVRSDNYEKLLEWLPGADDEVQHAVQHALNTLERDTIQSSLPSATLVKKRKL